jgi:hypothetical protein
MLGDQDEGTRATAIAIVQWEWPSEFVDNKMHFIVYTQKARPPPPPTGRLTYLPQLIHLICHSSSGFENYLAVHALWSLLSRVEQKTMPSTDVESIRRLPRLQVPHANGHWQTDFAPAIEQLYPMSGVGQVSEYSE